jgi:hypothetical protein
MGHTGFVIKQGLGQKQVKERRKAPRFDASAIPNLKIINHAGRGEIKLINISRRGALIEGGERMPLGSCISLQLFIAKSVYPLRGRITRCNLSSMNNKAPQYQCAVEFDEDFTLLPASNDKD